MALKNCKNDIVLTLTPDVIINKNLILSLEKLLNNFKNFTLIAPEYKNQNIYKTLSPFDSDSSGRLKKLRILLLKMLKKLIGVFVLLTKKFKSTKILDENYFMYFETTDLCNELVNKIIKCTLLKI